MPLPYDKTQDKQDYEILFRDSNDYFSEKNARLVYLNGVACFFVFDDKDNLKYTAHYPLINIYRIKTYAPTKLIKSEA